MALFFRDRADAGKRLAEALAAYAGHANAIVLALPRGGVPVGYEVARRLHLPLDVYVVRKLGVPGHSELAMGALAGDGTCIVDERLVASLGIDEAAIDEVVERERAEIHRRERAYRGKRAPPELQGRTAILVDDGVATGATMRAAVAAVRAHRPAEVVVAVPVGAERTCAALRSVADRVVCPHALDSFIAVGLYYENFTQTSDDEVRRLIA